MQFKKWIFSGIALALLGVVVVALVRTYPIQAQTSDGSAFSALLTEMRALRQSLDQLAGAQVRLQLATERWRIQQGIVDRAADEQRAAQDQLDAEKNALQQTEQSVRQYERALATESDPAQRSVWERELQSALASAEQSKQRLLRLQERLSQTHSTLQSEQAKVQELVESLESLDRTINPSTPRKR